jgi:homoserine O-acetyltransferase
MTLQAASPAVEPDCRAAHLAVTIPPASLAFDRREGEHVLRLAPKYAAAARDVRVRWALHGAAHTPVVVVQGGISAHRHVVSQGNQVGWWDALVGPGHAIDTNRFRVLSIDWIERADLGDALAVSTTDQADALAALLAALDIGRIHAFIGASYGAMVGLAFAARHPRHARRLVAIAGAHRAHPLSIALRNLQREIVRLGDRLGDSVAGLDLARRLAMTTDRGEREFAERCAGTPVFDSQDDRHHFPEEGWLKAAGASFAQRFGTERFLALSESIDLHAVSPEDIRLPTTLVGIASDRVVPLADLCDLQRRCGTSATLHVIDSRYGHDAFLKEDVQIGALLHEALNLTGA